MAAPNGNATIRVCLVYYRSTSGTYYYQGAIDVGYTGAKADAADMFSATSMAVPQSTGKATTLVDCPRIQWANGGALWCFSKTVTSRGAGEKLYAKGILIDAAGVEHTVWSPVLTTS